MHVTKDEAGTLLPTVVQDVVLTEQALDQLRRYQDEDNGFLHSSRRELADIVCLLVQFFDEKEMNDADEKRVVRAMTVLSYIRDEFETLMKPEKKEGYHGAV